MLNYVLPVVAALYALLNLIKDWKAHQHRWRQVLAFILIAVIGVGTGINNYYGGKAAAKRDKDLRNQISSLRDQISNLVETSSFNAQRDALAQELKGIHEDLRDGFSKLGAAIKPRPVPQAVSPPSVPHVKIVQHPTPAKSDAAPYGLQIIVQPDTQMPAAFRIECDGPIADSDFYIAGVGPMMTVRTTIEPNAYLISIGFPQIGPSTPLVVNLYSRDKIQVTKVDPLPQ
ncbi:MAG TPA: hypothetical protein VEE85_02410 [Candidatus Bathyarchaeia archaeon]|nr:hypothetical protein [Candidatus Bathyarchaeia archaeon]